MVSWNIKESHYYINMNNKEHLCHQYLTLDIWFTKQFSIGYDYTLCDGLPMQSLRLGWLWMSLCEHVEMEKE